MIGNIILFRPQPIWNFWGHNWNQTKPIYQSGSNVIITVGLKVKSVYELTGLNLNRQHEVWPRKGVRKSVHLQVQGQAVLVCFTFMRHSLSRPSTNLQLVWAMTAGDRLESFGCWRLFPRLRASCMYFWRWNTGSQWTLENCMITSDDTVIKTEAFSVSFWMLVKDNKPQSLHLLPYDIKQHGMMIKKKNQFMGLWLTKYSQ